MKSIIFWLLKLFQRKPKILFPNVKQPAKSIANEFEPVKPEEPKYSVVTDVYHYSDKSKILK